MCAYGKKDQYVIDDRLAATLILNRVSIHRHCKWVYPLLSFHIVCILYTHCAHDICCDFDEMPLQDDLDFFSVYLKLVLVRLNKCRTFRFIS